MSQPAAGWYPDPGGSGGRRYWNGSGWTDHVAPPPAPEQPASQAPATDVPGRAADETAVLAPSDAVGPPPPAGPPANVPPPAPPPPPPAQWPPAAGLNPVAAGPAERLGPDGQVLSGWWRRFFGYLIDNLLISLVTFAGVFLVGMMTGGFGELVDVDAWNEWIDNVEQNPGYQPSNQEVMELLGPGLLPLIGWVTLASLVLGFLNGVILVMMSGQTVGDRMVHNRKVIAGRRIPGFGAAFVRWIIPGVLSLFSWVVPLIGQVPWILDYLWPLWDQQKQTWHDKAAGTVVERSDLTGEPVR